MASIIDFDILEEWGPWVGAVVADLAGEDFICELRRSRPEYIEDAHRLVCDRLSQDGMAEVAIQLRPYSVRLYHGTRLTDGEIQQIQKLGLRPLRLADRKDSLAELLRLHPRWPAVASEFENVIAAIGPGARAGRREDGHVHACFSRFALLGSCSHYLAYGAEVDGHICHRLFGDDSANSLFRRQRKAYLISFDVPFDVAAQGCVIDVIEAGRSRLTGKLVGTWAYSLSHSDFTVASQRDPMAARIEGTIVATQISVGPVADDEIDWEHAQ